MRKGSKASLETRKKMSEAKRIKVDISLLIKLYNQYGNLDQVSEKMGISRSVLSIRLRENGIKKEKGKSHLSSHGYWIDYVNGKKVYRHHKVFLTENDYGLYCVPAGWVIHHKDENKLNNNISNLAIVPRELHNKYHRGLLI